MAKLSVLIFYMTFEWGAGAALCLPVLRANSKRNSYSLVLTRTNLREFQVPGVLCQHQRGALRGHSGGGARLRVRQGDFNGKRAQIPSQSSFPVNNESLCGTYASVV